MNGSSSWRRRADTRPEPKERGPGGIPPGPFSLRPSYLGATSLEQNEFPREDHRSRLEPVEIGAGGDGVPGFAASAPTHVADPGGKHSRRELSDQPATRVEHRDPRLTWVREIDRDRGERMERVGISLS